MNKLEKIIKRCKCGVYITINQHRDFYENIQNYIEDYTNEDDRDNIEKEVMDNIINLDTFITLQFYPDTPNGFYLIHHYDLNKAIDMALETDVFKKPNDNKESS